MEDKFITNYKKKAIFYIDYRGLKEEQMIEVLKAAVERAKEGNLPNLLLINTTGTDSLPNFISKAASDMKIHRHLAKKAAIVGITGYNRQLLIAYNFFTKFNMRSFDDEESAKEWLIKD